VSALIRTKPPSAHLPLASDDRQAEQLDLGFVDFHSLYHQVEDYIVREEWTIFKLWRNIAHYNMYFKRGRVHLTPMQFSFLIQPSTYIHQVWIISPGPSINCSCLRWF
jgi:hypothetical protein